MFCLTECSGQTSIYNLFISYPRSYHLMFILYLESDTVRQQASMPGLSIILAILPWVSVLQGPGWGICYLICYFDICFFLLHNVYFVFLREATLGELGWTCIQWPRDKAKIHAGCSWAGLGSLGWSRLGWVGLAAKKTAIGKTAAPSLGRCPNSREMEIYKNR